MNSVNELVSGIQLPKMALIQQHFPGETCPDPLGTLRQQLADAKIAGRLHPGMSIAVTAGSRGICDIAPITRTLLDVLKEYGTHPFLVSAMGSHGGATCPGQMDVLASLGITEESMGVPIRPGVDVVQLGTISDGSPVVMDRQAYEADGIVLLNRVKPHTAFRGKYESGLMKMMAVGLGNQIGADSVHSKGPGKIGLRVEEIAKVQLAKANILFGVALLENAQEQISEIHALLPEEIPEQEPELLNRVRRMMPSLYLDDLDVLVVDRIGKNISGGGMDPNVIGGLACSDGTTTPRPQQVVALDLTDETHGAAFGIGAADVTTQRLFHRIDRETTYPNCLTTGASDQVKIPMIMDSDRLAIQAAVKMLLGRDRVHPRIIRIEDTLHTERIWISEVLLEEAKNHPGITILEPPAPWPFDDKGDLF